jgi:hypothetical protein
MDRFNIQSPHEESLMGQERWFYLVIASLATWRVTHLLAVEDGPGDVIATVRQWLGSGFFGKLIDCFYCLSLWIAAPVACLPMNNWREWPLLWLAVSGAACLLEMAGSHPLTIQQIPQREE